ncbi:MAG: response regulator [Rhodospirillales bacterium]|nr:response regulator [Rhodospirillales bacterium]
MARANIVVIDNSSTVCKFIAGALASPDYQVIEAFDMETGLKLLEQFSVKLVITDILLPKMGGLAGIVTIRAQWPEIGIIAMSAGTESMDYNDALAAARKLGAEAVMKKPFTEDALKTVVGEVVSDLSEGSKRKRLLVVDDSRTIRRLLTQELTTAGYISKSAASMEEALDSTDIVGLDLIITDIFMPGLGGIEGITRIHENWPDIKIIAISGGWESMGSDDALAAAKKIGADAVLKKPFDMAILGTTIEQVLGA